jgi:hydroxylamine reductase
MEDMFCYQCEQTAFGTGCTKVGVCGKTPDTAGAQDLLTHVVVGIAEVAVEARKVGISDPDANRFSFEALFSTLTNVDFDTDRLCEMVRQGVKIREALKDKVKAAGGNTDWKGAAIIQPAADNSALIAQAKNFVVRPVEGDDPNIQSLKHISLFGIRGLAAYADHARILGKEDEKVYADTQECLAALEDPALGLNDWIGITLKIGGINLRAMELLDEANTGVYGHPTPTKVPLGHKKGKAILVSGHDLKDLELLLTQTEGKGINIYTHGEMLPTHAYPGLKKYPHFYGHYGTAWQNQRKEFADFPGAILMTTNCIQRPKDTYTDNIFTTGLVGWPGLTHIGCEKDFAPVIQRALAMPGFTDDVNGKEVTCGFARNTVMSVAGQVIDAVKAGAISHFFLVAGCDGAKPGRNYYTEFVEKTPKDTIVLTLACGKFRFFDKDLGDIGGIPRLLDVGQCNDAYSAIQIAVALANAFGVGVNDLPLSMVLSWYEQKACAILLTLLHLGIKGIRLGPSLPAFITPAVLDVLVKTFDIKPISTPDEDLKAILGDKYVPAAC